MAQGSTGFSKKEIDAVIRNIPEPTVGCCPFYLAAYEKLFHVQCRLHNIEAI